MASAGPSVPGLSAAVDYEVKELERWAPFELFKLALIQLLGIRIAAKEVHAAEPENTTLHGQLLH